MLKYLNADFGEDITSMELDYIKAYRKAKHLWKYENLFKPLISYVEKKGKGCVSLGILKMHFMLKGFECSEIDETITLYQDFWYLNKEKDLLILRKSICVTNER